MLDQVLRAIRSALSPDIHEQLLITDLASPLSGRPLSQLRLIGEGAAPAEEAYHHYVWKYEQAASDWARASLLQGPGPQWFGLQTENRMAWAHNLPALFLGLKGLPVTISLSKVWRWDRQNPRPNGSPRYVPIYAAKVCLTKGCFDPSDSLAANLSNICAANHPLADQNLFDWQTDTCGKTLFHQYEWNSTGFLASFGVKGDMELACQTLFGDLPHVVSREGKGENLVWRVAVDLAQAGKGSPA